MYKFVCHTTTTLTVLVDIAAMKVCIVYVESVVQSPQ